LVNYGRDVGESAFHGGPTQRDRTLFRRPFAAAAERVRLLNQTASERRNRPKANEFFTAERLGRGAYESPRPGTLGTKDETASTVTASGWPDDDYLSRCVSRRHDRGSIIFTSQQPAQIASRDGRTALAFLLNSTRSEPRTAPTVPSFLSFRGLVCTFGELRGTV
jgi:hypothetical protein